jgi:WD40 repeat protein
MWPDTNLIAIDPNEPDNYTTVTKAYPSPSGYMNNAAAYDVKRHLYFATPASNGILVVIDTKNKKVVHSFKNPENVYSLAFDTSSNSLIALSNDKLLSIDPATGKNKTIMDVKSLEDRGFGVSAYDAHTNTFYLPRVDDVGFYAIDLTTKKVTVWQTVNIIIDLQIDKRGDLLALTRDLSSGELQIATFDVKNPWKPKEIIANILYGNMLIAGTYSRELDEYATAVDVPIGTGHLCIANVGKKTSSCQDFAKATSIVSLEYSS